MRIAVGLVMTLCACFSKPEATSRDGGGGSGSDGGTNDGVQPDACPGGQWIAPSKLSAFTGSVTGEPTMTNDRLLIYWSYMETVSEWHIYWADRLTPTGTFTVHTIDPIDTSGTEEDSDPSVTDDGLHVLYRDGSPNVLWQATRPSRISGAWTKTRRMLPDTISELEVSGDGLTVYWTDQGQHLYSATRSSVTGEFGNKIGIGSNVRYPSISGDQKTLYFTNPTTNEIQQMTRPAVGAAFEETSRATIFSSMYREVDVTSDGSAMVVSIGSIDLGIAELNCP